MSEYLQHRQTLEEMDIAIKNASGNSAELQALLVKKYAFAQSLEDERLQLNILRDLLEMTPDSSFAKAELSKLDATKLKPHSQIQYLQLCIYIANQPEERRKYQLELAKQYTMTSQLNNAITLYHAIIDECPEHLDARYRLIDLLESQKNWKSAENVLLALISAESSKEKRYEALVRLAVIQDEHMAMTSRALMTYFAALDTLPHKLNALHCVLCEISERLRTFAPLLDKYEDFTARTYEHDIRKMATLLLANIYAKYIKKPALAVNVLDEFYYHSGASDAEFVQMVIDFYEEIKNWNGYIRIFSDLLARTTSHEEKVLYSLNIARVYTNHLHDATLAAQYARIAAHAQPKSAEHWLEIAECLLAAESSEDAIVCLNHAAKMEADTSRQAVILFETARLMASLGRLEDACSTFHQASLHCTQLDLMTPIAEMLIALSTAQRHQKAFTQICGDLVRCCPASETPSLLLQQALTLVRVFQAPKEAKAILNANSELLKSLDLEQSLILMQLLAAMEEYPSAMDLSNTITHQFELTKAQKLECLRTALKCGVELDIPETVRKTAEDILAHTPDDPNALYQLILLNYYAGKWDQATADIQNLLPNMGKLDEDSAILVYYYYGEILYAAEHEEHALKNLDKALEIRPTFRPAADLKLTILIENKRWHDALPVFRQLLQLTDDVEVQGAIHKRIAEIHHFYIQDREQAIIEYEQALALGGDVEDVPIRLLQLYQELGLWSKAAMTAQILAMAQTNSADAKFDYLMLLSQIQADHLHAVADAIRTRLEAFILNPFAQDNLNQLIPTLIQYEQWENLDGIFDHLCGLVISHQDDAVQTLIWLSQNAGHVEATHPMMERINAYFQAHHIEIDLLKEAQKATLSTPEDASNAHDSKASNALSESSTRLTAAEKAIASIQPSDLTNTRTPSAPQNIPSTLMQTRRNHAITRNLAQSTLHSVQPVPARSTVEPQSSDVNAKQKRPKKPHA